jgi:hypothetical protein
MTAHKLILHPQYPDSVPKDRRRVVSALQTSGLLGDEFQFRQRVHYLPGPQFLQLITFLGCSPYVLVDVPRKLTRDELRQTPEFCHVEIGDVTPQIAFLGGSNVRTPRCPHCRYQEEAWPELLKRWHTGRDPVTWRCPDCQADLRVYELNWRQQAGFARFWLAIWGVYESEAVPGEQLLNLLEIQTGSPWTYFYYRK